MQIVANIDDNLYTRLFDNGDIDAVDMQKACVAIRKGTPLPKGHGRLIDVSDIEWAKHREERNYIDYEVIDWDDIANAPTIIEADKEVQE